MFEYVEQLLPWYYFTRLKLKIPSYINPETISSVGQELMGHIRQKKQYMHKLKFILILLKKIPGGDRLSHGETPHYHWRCSVSRLSSGWNQVGPERYGRQENW